MDEKIFDSRKEMALDTLDDIVSFSKKAGRFVAQSVVMGAGGAVGANLLCRAGLDMSLGLTQGQLEQTMGIGSELEALPISVPVSVEVDEEAAAGCLFGGGGLLG